MSEFGKGANKFNHSVTFYYFNVNQMKSVATTQANSTSEADMIETLILRRDTDKYTYDDLLKVKVKKYRDGVIDMINRYKQAIKKCEQVHDSCGAYAYSKALNEKVHDLEIVDKFINDRW